MAVTLDLIALSEIGLHMCMLLHEMFGVLIGLKLYKVMYTTHNIQYKVIIDSYDSKFNDVSIKKRRIVPQRLYAIGLTFLF